ncbi:putative membrane protein [Luteibacter sp. HA06]
MSYRPAPRRSVVANAIYGVLNPIPFGFFVAALIFDVIYAKTGEMLWMKGAAWLIAIGLVFAIIPRLVNLVQVWITSRRSTVAAERLDFWLNLLAIIVAVVNAFVHSRDAYSVIPAGAWLSALTVLLLAVAHIVIAVRPTASGNLIHE